MAELARWALLVLGALLTLGTALSLSRSPHWAVRLWDFPRVQIAVTATVVGILYLAFSFAGGPAEWGWLAALAAAVAWQLRWILPYTPLAPTAVERSRAPRPESTLRLLTSNVLMENEEHERLLRVVRDADPDVVLAVEVDGRWAAALDALAADYPHVVRHPQENYYGMMLLSRLPLHHARIDFLVQDDIPSLHTEVELRDGTRVALHGLHPRPPEPIRDQESTPRDAELVIVGRAIGEADDRPTVVAGDLNDVAWSRTTQLFLRLSGLLDPRLGRGFYDTYDANTPLLRYPLDHVFCSNHFRLVELRRLPYVGSDHFPILVELSHEPGARGAQPEPAADAADRAEAHERLEEEAEAAATGDDRPNTG